MLPPLPTMDVTIYKKTPIHAYRNAVHKLKSGIQQPFVSSNSIYKAAARCNVSDGEERYPVLLVARRMAYMTPKETYVPRNCEHRNSCLGTTLSPGNGQPMPPSNGNGKLEI